MAGSHGRSCVVCLIIRTGPAGSQGMGVWRCTQSCSTRRTVSACTSQSQPAAFTAPTMADAHGRHKTAAFGLCSYRINILSSDSVYTRSQCILLDQNVFSYKIIGASIAPMTMAKTGQTLRMAYRRILALL